MKIGDLVCLTSEDELGIVVDVCTGVTDDPIDMMFPYNVHFANCDDDWFGD